MTDTYPSYGPDAPTPVADLLAGDIAPVPRCTSCGRRFYYHRTRCPRCFSTDVRWEPVDEPFDVEGAALVWRQQADIFAAQAPVLMVAARLDDDLTVIAEGHGWPAGERPAAGTPVAYVVARRPDGTPVPIFRPLPGADSMNRQEHR